MRTEMTEEEVFRRRESLSRTPPRSGDKPPKDDKKTEEQVSKPVQKAIFGLPRPRANSMDLTMFGLRREPLKRRREEEESQEKGLSHKIEDMRRAVKDLSELTESIVNTKLEIKRAAKRLMWQMEKLAHEWQEEAQKGEKSSKARAVSKQSASISTQTEGPCSVLSRKERESQLLAALRKEEGFGKISEFLAERWPDQAYRRTVVVEGGVNTEEGNVAILIDPKTAKEDKRIKHLEETFIGLTQLAENNEGGIDYVICTSLTQSSRKEETENKRVAYLVPHVQEEEESKEKLFEKMRNLKKELLGHNVGSVRIVPTKSTDIRVLRRVTEYVCTETKISVQIYVPKDMTPRATLPKPKSKPRKEASVVTVKSEGKTYADLLKTLKSKVDIEKIDVNIQRMRKNAKGDLVLTVDGGVEKASCLQKEISKIGRCEVSSRKRFRTSIFILGMDESITKDEVREAIIRDTGAGVLAEDIKRVTKGRYDLQTALVDLPEETASKLLAAKHIRIGWSNCAIREKVNLTRCYRCLEFGHRARECKSEKNRMEDCLNCGASGHKSNECKNSPSCIICGVEGHRADSIRCPQYKAEIEKLRRARSAPKGRTKPINNDTHNVKQQ